MRRDTNETRHDLRPDKHARRILAAARRSFAPGATVVPAQAGTQASRRQGKQELDARGSLYSGQPKAGPEYGHDNRKRGTRRGTRRMRKPKPKKLSPAQWQAQHDAAQFEMRRKQCILFQFWRVCRTRACARARQCAGDPHACFERWWPVMPEAFKVEYRALVTAFASGASKAEAGLAADSARVRWQAENP